MGKFGSIVTSLVGAGVGFAIGGPSGARLGLAIGNMIGGIAFAQDNIPSSVSLPDLALPKTQRGSVLPYIYGGTPVGETQGGVKLAGVFMDGPADGYVTKSVEVQRVSTGIPFRKKKKVNVDVYHLTCAIGFADATVGPVQADYVFFGGDCVFNRTGTAITVTDGDPPPSGGLLDAITHTVTDSGSKGFDVTYDPTTLSEIGDDIELYRGTWTQMPSPALQALHPQGVSAYRGIPYIVIKHLRLEKYGNAIPEIKIICSNGITHTGEILLQHLMLAGVPEDHIQIEFAEDHVHGAFHNVFGPGRGLCEQVATFAGLSLVEYDDKIRTVSRSNPNIVTLTREEIGAHAAGQEIPSLIKSTINSDASLPSDLTASFINVDTNWETDTAEAKRWSARHYNPKTMEVGIVSRKVYMNPRVKLWLNEIWAGKEPMNVQLPWSHIRSTPGMVYRVPDEDGDYRYFFAEQQAIGSFIKNSGRSWDPGIFREIAQAELPTFPLPGVNAAPPPIVFAADAVGSQPDDVDVPRIILAATNTEDSWRGMAFISDDVTGFGTVDITARAKMGRLLTTMPIVTPGVFHPEAVVRVEMIYGTPSSVPEDDARAGANLVLLQSGLYFTFKTVDQISSTVWDLSGLWTGIYGSDYDKGAAVDTLALFMTDEQGLYDGGFERVEIPRTSIGTSIPFSAESLAVDPIGGKVTGMAMTPRGNNLKQLPVYNVESTWAAGNLTLSWRYRSRNKDDSYWTTGVPIVATDPDKAVVHLSGGGANERAVTGTSTVFTAAELLAIYGVAPVPGRLAGTIWGTNTFATKGHPQDFEDL